MASITAIPRFLLPRLSWQTTTSRSAAIVTPIRCLKQTPAPKPLHRSITSEARAWQKQRYPTSALLRPKVPLPTRISFAPSNYTRCFSSAPTLYRDHHFDTLKFVQRLKAEGFSEDQSKAMMLVLSDVIEESIQNLTRTMVLKEGKPSSRSHRRSIVNMILPQTPTAAPTPKKSTSRNSAPSSSPSTAATHP